jgi:hypothetical protein
MRQSRFQCPGCGRLVRGGVKQLCPKCTKDRAEIVQAMLGSMSKPRESRTPGKEDT